MQTGACTHFVRTLTRLRREKTDVHAASFFGFDFFLSAELTELCEAISVRRRQTEKTEALRGLRLCVYQNFFFLHSHKLKMTKSTLTPMTAG